MDQVKTQTIVLGVLGTALAGVGGYLLWKKTTAKRYPKDWIQIGTLGDLTIYPVKSGKYLKLREGYCSSLGLLQINANDESLPLRDRFFVVYDEEIKKHISLLNYPKLIKLKVEATSKTSVVFIYPGFANFHLNLPNSTNAKTDVRLWCEKAPSIDCGDGIAKWISNIMLSKDAGLRVGFWSDSFKTRRNVMPSKLAKLYNKLRNEDTGAYSDLSSYLLINKASVDDMNTKIGPDANYTPLHFRPNLTVDGAKPYDEDNWDWIKIGEKVILRNFRPCTRCAMTTIDPDTGIKDPRYEPIKTLRKYRQLEDPVLRAEEDNCPAMGIYIGAYEEGPVKLGDPIYVTFK